MIPSPCVNICKLDARDVCRGCGRHINEIIEWTTAGDERKHAIIAAARQRLALMPTDPPPPAKP